MNDLQLAAMTFPTARVAQIGREHFKVLRHSPYNASVGLTLNR